MKSAAYSPLECFICGGHWVRIEAIQELVGKEQAMGTRELLAQMETDSHTHNDSLQCPECYQRLRILHSCGTELDWCPAGHGIFFETNELQALFPKAQEGNALLEAGTYVAGESVATMVASAISKLLSPC